MSANKLKTNKSDFSLDKYSRGLSIPQMEDIESSVEEALENPVGTFTRVMREQSFKLSFVAKTIKSINLDTKYIRKGIDDLRLQLIQMKSDLDDVGGSSSKIPLESLPNKAAPNSLMNMAPSLLGGGAMGFAGSVLSGASYQPGAIGSGPNGFSGNGNSDSYRGPDVFKGANVEPEQLRISKSEFAAAEHNPFKAGQGDNSIQQGYGSATGTEGLKGTKANMKGIYDAFINAGFSKNQAKALTAEVGRENDYADRYVYGSHVDPSNGQVNVGMLSWQKDRGPPLYEKMQNQGLIKDGKMVHSQEALNQQALYVRDEIENNPEYAKTKEQFLNNPDIDPEEASKILGRNYIRWRYDDPRYASHNDKRRGYLNQLTGIVDDYDRTHSQDAPLTSMADAEKSFDQKLAKLNPGTISAENIQQVASNDFTNVKGGRSYTRRKGVKGEYDYGISQSGQSEFGQLGDKGAITRIKLDSGKTVDVNKNVSERFRQFLNKLESSGYKIDSLGGYSFRGKAQGGGSYSNVWSNPSTHATGTSIDLNPDRNKFKGGSTDMPKNIEALANEYGLSWGAGFGDPMHFEAMSRTAWEDRLIKNGMSKTDANAYLDKYYSGDHTVLAGDVLGVAKGNQLAETMPVSKPIPTSLIKDKKQLIQTAQEQAKKRDMGTGTKLAEAKDATIKVTQPPKAPTSPVKLANITTKNSDAIADEMNRGLIRKNKIRNTPTVQSAEGKGNRGAQGTNQYAVMAPLQTPQQPTWLQDMKDWWNSPSSPRITESKYRDKKGNFEGDTLKQPPTYKVEREPDNPTAPPNQNVQQATMAPVPKADTSPKYRDKKGNFQGSDLIQPNAYSVEKNTPTAETQLAQMARMSKDMEKLYQQTETLVTQTTKELKRDREVNGKQDVDNPATPSLSKPKTIKPPLNHQSPSSLKNAAMNKGGSLNPTATTPGTDTGYTTRDVYSEDFPMMM